MLPLNLLEERLPQQSIDEVELNNKIASSTSNEVHHILDQLKLSSRVVVPTDKTNSFRTILVNHYIRQVLLHIDERAIEISRAER